jgi:hypothetical protein
MRHLLSMSAALAILALAGCSGDPGPSAAVRVVTGTDSVACAAGEILAGFVCASGATDGAKCSTPGTAATGLCVRQ